MAYEVITTADLDACRRLIAERFEEDADVRAELAPLPPGYFASGQYFDQRFRNQRGLHGTAAALRVLGAEVDRDEKARKVAAGIVRYLEERSDLELGLAREVMRNRRPGDTHLQDEVAYWTEKLRHDGRNTVKQAELLWALGFTKHGVAKADHLRDAIIQRLLDGQSRQASGWAFVLDPTLPPNSVATAYVLRGLHAESYPVAQWASALRRDFEDRSKNRRDDRTAQADCLVLLVLLEVGAIELTGARQSFDDLWRTLSPQLATLNESRWQLYDGRRENYVLIPWQMHLVVLASRLRPWRRFRSPEAQKLVAAVVDAVRERRSLNPQHDGLEVSTRAYAYVYDMAHALLSAQGTKQVSVDWLATQAFGRGAGLRRWTARGAWVVAFAGAAALVGYTVVSWARHGANVPSIGASVLAGVLLSFLLWLARRPKGPGGRG